MAGLCCLASCSFVIFFHTQYRRLKAEADAADNHSTQTETQGVMNNSTNAWRDTDSKQCTQEHAYVHVWKARNRNHRVPVEHNDNFFFYLSMPFLKCIKFRYSLNSGTFYWRILLLFKLCTLHFLNIIQLPLLILDIQVQTEALTFQQVFFFF